MTLIRRLLRRDTEPWFLAVALASLAAGTASILIPLWVATWYGGSVGDVGVLSSLVSLVGVVGSLFWGRLSDAAHRRKLFVVGSYIMTGVSYIVMGMAGSYGQLVAWNMVQNLFWVANASVTVLIVIENQDEDKWETKIGKLNQAGALGWVAGLALGTLALVGGGESVGEAGRIRLLFPAIGAVAIGAALLAARYIPRTTPQYTKRRFRGVALAVGNLLFERARFSPFHLYHRISPKRIWASLQTEAEGFRPGTKRFLLTTLVAYVALGFIAIPLPLLLRERLGVSSSGVFLYSLVQNIGVALAYPLVTRRIARKGTRGVHGVALAVRVILFGAGAVWLSGSGESLPAWILLPAFLVYGVSWAYFQLSGIALMSRVARAKNRGLALGLYNALAGVGWIVAGVGSGKMADGLGYQASTAVAAGLLLVALLMLRTVPDPAKAGNVSRKADGRSIGQPASEDGPAKTSKTEATNKPQGGLSRWIRSGWHGMHESTSSSAH